MTSLYAVSPKAEHYYVQNNLESTIIVSGVFMQRINDNQWVQKIQNTEVLVTDFLPESGNKTCKSGKRCGIIDFIPNVSLMSDEFSKARSYLLSQPVPAKMRDIFSSFAVYDENGTLLFDLDTLEKVRIEIEREDRIILVVDDYLYE